MKEKLKKILDFLKEDSLQSLLVWIIILIIFAKFIFIPLSSFILKTPYPYVIIESGSMHHDGFFNFLKLESSFDKWWEENGEWYKNNNITREQALQFPFRTGMEVGDLVILSKRKKINVGDVIVFKAEGKKPIIHRVVMIKNESGTLFYSTKGDANPSQLEIEKEIKENQIIGIAVGRIPYVGLPKVIVVKILENS